MASTVDRTDFILRIAERMQREHETLARATAERIAARRQTAWEEIGRLVKAFHAADPRLSRVVLFGSLARDELVNDRFDIDLAVESSRYFDLLGIAMRSDFPVDLVDTLHVGAHIKGRIEIEGRVLFRGRS